MKGLLIKDILTIRSTLKLYTLILLIYGGIGFFTNSSSFFTSFVAVLVSMLPITAMSYDERSKFDPYALTMPINRNTLVIEKYLLGFSSAIFGCLLAAIIMLFDSKSDIIYKIMVPLISFLFSLTFQALITPIMFKMGVEKGRIILMLMFLIPTILIIALSSFATPLLDIINGIPIPLLIISLIIIILLMYISSLLISIKIINKKVW